MADTHAYLEADGCRAIIDLEHGGRLASLVIDGWELLVPEGRDIYHWGSFVLAPWTGRLRQGRFSWRGRDYQMPLTMPPHALHGLVVDRPWELLGPGVVGIELEDPWPWHGRIIHTVRLEQDRLESQLMLIADEEMPVAMGWHPWFPQSLRGPGGRRLGPIELDVQPGRMYAHDEGGLPRGDLVHPVPRPWDFCFVELAAPPRIRWPGDAGTGLELTIESDCPYWVLYDEEPQAICVEPWTAPPNSFNLPSPEIVTPAAPRVATMTWHWRWARAK